MTAARPMISYAQNLEDVVLDRAHGVLASTSTLGLRHRQRHR